MQTDISYRKDILAKLLAKENIFVRHDVNAPTASFDIKNRVLSLPVLVDMSTDIYDLMVGHEVGHALWTLLEDWEAAISVEEVNKQILNIVEDARIEKRVKRMYPGITKSFISGYRNLYNREFFGTTPMNELSVIDRINLHFKMGATFGVPFNKEEEEAVTLVDGVETFDDAVRVTKILQQMYVNQQLADLDDAHEQWMRAPSNSFDDDDEVSDGGQSQAPNIEATEDGNDETGADFKELQSDDGDDEAEKKLPSSKEFNANKHYIEPGEFETEETWENRKQDLVDHKSDQPVYFTLPKPNMDELIVSYKTVGKEFPTWVWDYMKNRYPDNPAEGELKISNTLADFNTFKTSSNKIINYMIKEFERKKAAKEYRRASVAKTGVIDVNKIHSYQYNEDIFLKKTLMPDGKNHGLIMLLDWSGSMCTHMYPTIQQLLNLVWFCQKVNIPFEVYAFSGVYWGSKRSFANSGEFDEATLRYYMERSSFKTKPGDAQLGHLHKDMALLNFFSSKMTARQITDMSKALYGFCHSRDGYYSRYSTPMLAGEGPYALGATPLVEALVGMQSIVPWFKQSNKLDVVNMITLTDGGGNSYFDNVYTGETNNPRSGKLTGYGVKPVYVDPITRRQYNIEKMGFGKGVYSRMAEKQTAFLYTLLKDRYGINNIGIYLDGMAKNTVSRKTLEEFLGWYRNNVTKYQKVRARAKKDGFCTLKIQGFDEYYIIPAGRIGMDVVNPMESVTEGMKKNQIKTAFKKSLKQKFGSRIFVDKMMNLIV